MKFHNKPNTKHITVDGKEIWDSRSVAVNGVILCRCRDALFVATSTRGTNAADFQLHQNLVAGYIDWNETATEAFIRETWEEIGLNLFNVMADFKVIHEDIFTPWEVNSDITNNKQNVSIRFGILFEIKTIGELPKLSTENNEVDNESVNPEWTPVNQLKTCPNWAFHHDEIILNYINRLTQMGKVSSKT